MSKKSKALATQETSLPTMAVADDAYRLAQRMANTEFVPTALKGRPEAVLACILVGHEAGISPMQALAKIHIIEGRPAFSAELMRALVLSAGHHIHIKETNSTRCVVVGTRSDDPGRETEITWTMDDAKRAGVDGRNNWRKFPNAMLLARATSQLCRLMFPDVLAGLSYTSEELTDGDVVQEADIVAARYETVEEAPKKKRTTRKAKQAATSTTEPAAEPEVVEAPPLPEEDDPPLPDDDDIIDGEVIEDTVPETQPSGTVEEPEDIPIEDDVPLEDDVPPRIVEDDGPRMKGPQLVAMKFGEVGITDRARRMAICSELCDRTITSGNDLDADEVSMLVAILSEPDAAATLADVGLPAADVSGDGEPGDQQPEPLSSDEWRALARTHKVKVAAVIKYAGETLGHKIVTIDDLVGASPDIDSWLAEWIKKGGSK